MKVQVVATQRSNEDGTLIGTYNQGVVVEDDAFIDIASGEAILVRWINRRWVLYSQAREFDKENPATIVVPTPMYERVFIQGCS